MSKKMTEAEALNVIAEAMAAGQAAAAACVPTPMHVAGYAPIADGPCGFAWVNVKPAYSPVAKALLAANLGRKDGYEGGVCVWISDYNQSMAKKEAHARAYAKVLQDAGIRAYAGSRMD